MIQSPRLLLRPLSLQDAEALFGYRSDPEIARYQGWAPEDLAAARAFCAAQSEQAPRQPGTWMQLAICLEDGRMIGDVGVHTCADPRLAEFGVTLAPQHHGQGFANEAMLALFAWLFETCQIHRVSCSIDPRNLPSMAMARRLGMRQEAHMVQSLWFKGAWADDVVFALLAQEWRAAQARGPSTG